MSSPIITRIIEGMDDLPDDLQQPSGNAWDVLESLTGIVEAPADWSAEHDHYLYDTLKHQEIES